MSKLVPEMMYIVIPILAVIVYIYLSWQNVPVQCHTDLNSTHNVVLINLKKCIDNCWKKHDFGSDIEMEDCYTINLFVQDKDIIKNDFYDHNYVKLYFDSLKNSTENIIKIRYNATGKEISLVKFG